MPGLSLDVDRREVDAQRRVPALAAQLEVVRARHAGDRELRVLLVRPHLDALVVEVPELAVEVDVVGGREQRLDDVEGLAHAAAPPSAGSTWKNVRSLTSPPPPKP